MLNLILQASYTSRHFTTLSLILQGEIDGKLGFSIEWPPNLQVLKLTSYEKKKINIYNVQVFNFSLNTRQLMMVGKLQNNTESGIRPQVYGTLYIDAWAKENCWWPLFDG